ncbi:MAG: ABC transporter permease [Anaerolineaceae bacterium]|nr:ABC transporter permease [Anaerolineaceae bacterium]MCY4023309.1 ABC transporter permease [Anaerolineaceae bacterium]
MGAATGQTASLAAPRKAGRLNRFDNPWLNIKLVVGVIMVGSIILMGIFGPMLRDIDLAYVGRSPLNLPPVGFENMRGEGGDPLHPLGTDNSGRDMLSLIIVGAPNSLLVGFVAAGFGMLGGIVLGFTSGFLGGTADDIIRLSADITITIPSLLVLIVIQSLIPVQSLLVMAVLLSLFAWPQPTRLIRAQVMSMRESGYVKMAQLSGVPTSSIMFREMMPNLLPYLAASFIGNTTGSILAAVGLEILGLGPQRLPTLGRTIQNAIDNSGILRDMWWWWGLPTIILIVIFIGLLLINLGLDEVANPRLRKATRQ